MSISIENSFSEPETLQSAGRILDVLLCFNRGKREWGIAELASELGVHKSIIRRCVATLVAKGFLRQNPEDKRFRLGYVVFELGKLVLPGEEIKKTALPFMYELSKKTGASVFLTMERDGQAVCIGRIDAPKPLKVSFEEGRRSPLHAGASARVLLAYMPDFQVQRIIQAGLERFTENTLTEPERLLAELESTRRRGYAVSTGELDAGATAIAVPIFNESGGAIASLSISGPASDFAPERVPSLVDMTMASAMAVGRALFSGKGGMCNVQVTESVGH